MLKTILQARVCGNAFYLSNHVLMCVGTLSFSNLVHVCRNAPTFLVQMCVGILFSLSNLASLCVLLICVWERSFLSLIWCDCLVMLLHVSFKCV
jgi:hypothetical protein